MMASTTAAAVDEKAHLDHWNEEIKLVALSIVELCLTEGILVGPPLPHKRKRQPCQSTYEQEFIIIL